METPHEHDFLYHQASYGGLQVTLQIEVLMQTLWRHLERCLQYDDGTKEERKCLTSDGLSHGSHVTNWDFILGFSFF